LLFNVVGTVERLKLAFKVLEQGFLLLLGHALLLVALLDLLLLFLDALTKLCSISFLFFLEILLALEHVFVVSIVIIEVFFELSLHGLLLQLNVPQSSLLLLLLLSLVLLKSLLIRQGFAIDKSTVANELSSESGLLVGHLSPEIDLLCSMLLLEFLPHGGLFVLVSFLKLEIDVAEQIFLIQFQLLKGVIVGLLGHLIFHLFKLCLVNLEVFLDCISLGMLLVRVLSKEKLKHLLFLSELLHEEACHAL